MVKRFNRKLPVLILALLLFLLAGTGATFAVADQHIYDNAGLLSEPEAAELEAYAAEQSRVHGTDFIFLTTDSTDGKPIETYMGDFFDIWAVENNQENAVLLTVDMGNRQIFLSGFGTAEERLDDGRIDMVLDRIVPYMQAGDYGAAFRETVATSNRYMEYRPGVNPESIFLKTWFQAAVALLLGGIVVGTMLYNSGGRITTSSRTYMDSDHTRVRSSEDRFRNKTVTRRKIPQNKGGGGGGFGGGGMTGGGRSYSGGGRGF